LYFKHSLCIKKLFFTRILIKIHVSEILYYEINILILKRTRKITFKKIEADVKEMSKTISICFSYLFSLEMKQNIKRVEIINWRSREENIKTS